MAHLVRIETKDEPPSDDHPGGVLAGQVFEVELSDANKLYPNAKIVSNADGTKFEGDQPKAAKKNEAPSRKSEEG